MKYYEHEDKGTEVTSLHHRTNIKYFVIDEPSLATISEDLKRRDLFPEDVINIETLILSTGIFIKVWYRCN